MNDKENKITLYNPFVMLDFISPVYESEFDKEELRYVEKETTEFIDGIFVFDIKEVRIKYFHETNTLIRKGKKDVKVPTILIVLTDETELLSRQTPKEFMETFLPQYLLKINEVFPSEQS
jgi:hypothetical protein